MVLRAEFEQLLKNAVAEQADVIMAPHAIADIGTYKHHVGIVTGLRLALDLLEEAQSNINKRERGA